MKTRILAALILLGLFNTAGAVRVLKEVERPFELAVGQLALPTDAGGTLTIRECDTCKFGSYRLQGSTQFLLDGRQASYADFRRAVDSLRASAVGNTTVISVFIDRTTELVTRISVHQSRH
ncbi:MAG TPA: hypothetical protein VHH11_14200 [Gammaproteobacteria bacterium]|jgi:hypothetical protein|nr:hypothetical protein [Gammaproteobacteria bacterium]